MPEQVRSPRLHTDSRHEPDGTVRTQYDGMVRHYCHCPDRLSRRTLTASPPEGWQTFGFHAPMDSVPRLSFSDEHGEDGLPLWERHMYDDARSCALCKSATQESR